jgi:protein phosphatase
MTAPSPSEAQPSAAQLAWSGVTHVGRFRANNEDAFLALRFDGREVTYLGKTGADSLAGSDFVFAVSDGLGGAKSGEFASRIAVDRITRLLPRSFRLSAAGMATGFNDVLSELFAAIHSDLVQLGASYAECAGMGATLSLCWFRPGWMYFGHVGDSRIYHLPPGGGLVQLTHDHTHVGWLRRKGEINEREARTHPRRNALQQSLGAGTQFVEPHIGAVAHQTGDRFLVCSDGLVDGLWDRRIEEFIRTHGATPGDPEASRGLVEEAVRSSGRDNTTALLVELAPSPSPPARRVFVYGTLKRGGSNHGQLAGQSFVGEARTSPGFALFDLGDYPGMVAQPGGSGRVTGEVWSVDEGCLRRLDALEGMEEGLFTREPASLEHPFERGVEAYYYSRSVEGRGRVEGPWTR